MTNGVILFSVGLRTENDMCAMILNSDKSVEKDLQLYIQLIQAGCILIHRADKKGGKFCDRKKTRLLGVESMSPEHVYHNKDWSATYKSAVYLHRIGRFQKWRLMKFVSLPLRVGYFFGIVRKTRVSHRAEHGLKPLDRRSWLCCNLSDPNFDKQINCDNSFAQAIQCQITTYAMSLSNRGLIKIGNKTSACQHTIVLATNNQE